MINRYTQPLILSTILLLITTLTHATTIGSVSGGTITLTAGKVDGVQVGMMALVHGIANIGGKATEVSIAKVRVTAVNDRSCTASILEQSADATMPKISAGQKVVFQQALIPPSGKPSGELGNAKPNPPPPPPKDPYAEFSPLQLSEKADAAYSAGRYDEAEKLYSAVLRAVPDDPLSSKRLKELSGRKQQADAEAQRRAERMEKLKNAAFFLTRGDDAYRAGDYAVAASYYIKVSEVDATYRDAGGKYWLSKALAAKAVGDAGTLTEARVKLKGFDLPEPLNRDLDLLGPEEKDADPVSRAPDTTDQSRAPYHNTETANSRDLAQLTASLERGETVTFVVRTGPDEVHHWGDIGSHEVALSKTEIAFRTKGGANIFSVTPDKVLTLSIDPKAWRVQVKVAFTNSKGKEEKQKVDFYHPGATYIRPSILCPGCDTSLDSLYALLQKIKGER